MVEGICLLGLYVLGVIMTATLIDDPITDWSQRVAILGWPLAALALAVAWCADRVVGAYRAVRWFMRGM